MHHNSTTINSSFTSKLWVQKSNINSLIQIQWLVIKKLINGYDYSFFCNTTIHHYVYRLVGVTNQTIFRSGHFLGETVWNKHLIYLGGIDWSENDKGLYSWKYLQVLIQVFFAKGSICKHNFYRNYTFKMQIISSK